MLELSLGLILLLYSLFLALGVRNYFSTRLSSIGYFCLLIIATSGWMLGIYTFTYDQDIYVVTIAARILWAFAILMVLALMRYCYASALESEAKIPDLTHWLVNLISLLIPFLSVISIASEVTVDYVDPDNKRIIYGSLYGFVALVILLGSGLAVHCIRLSAAKSEGKNTSIFRIIQGGMSITLILLIITNLILPNLLGNSAYSFLGIYTTIPMVSSLAYAMVRHKYLNFRLLFGRLVYYFVTAIVPYFLFFIIAWVYEQVFGGVFVLPAYIIGIPVSLAFVFSFNSINYYIRNQVNSRLINPGYDPLETSERFTNEVSLVLDVEKIVDLMQGVIRRTVRPDYSAIVVYGEEQKKTENEVFVTTPQANLTPDVIAQIQQITNLLWQTLGKHPIVLDNIQYELELGIYQNTPNLALEAEKIMNQIGAKVIVQMSSRESVRGLYIIGQKEADTPFSSQDLDFLTTLANTCSVALERSLLYNEVQDFADTLQDKVDQATEELLKTNSELEVALEQVQEARRKERDMIDVMGHELRTPISIVRNALAMMQREREKHEGPIDTVKLDKYLSMGLESARREITLIETLLSATKVDASRLQLYLVQVPLSDVVHDGIEGQKPMLEEKNLKLIFDQSAADVVVYADRTRIQEVMDNFLSNALKYTMQGQVEIKYWKGKQWGWLSIADTGMGIDASDLRNLGKKFFRAKQYVGEGESSTQVVRPGGTGLGLYVTFELIRVMGGRLYINSQVGKGTTFTFCLPLHIDQTDKQIDQTFDAAIASGRQHIFINQPVPSDE